MQLNVEAYTLAYATIINNIKLKINQRPTNKNRQSKITVSHMRRISNEHRYALFKIRMRLIELS